MPNKRLAMRHIKDILRLKLEAKLSHRQIARSLGIGVGTVSRLDSEFAFVAARKILTLTQTLLTNHT